MDCSTPGFPAHHQLLELSQTHVHRVGDAIQPSHHFCHPLLLLAFSKSCPSSRWCHPTISSFLSFPSPTSFTLSQNQGLSQWASSSHEVAKVLEPQLQHQSFQWIFRIDFLYNWLVWFPCSPRDSQEFSPTPQFKSINSLVLSFLYDPTLTSIHDYWKNHSFD